MSDQNTPEATSKGETRVTDKEDAPHKRGKGRPFTPERAREAARKSASVRKAGAARERMVARGIPSSASDPPALQPGQIAVQTPVAAAAVMRALERAAVAGDPQAAGTLLRWTQAYPAVDTRVQLGELSAETRDQLLARLLRELSEDEAEKAAGRAQQTGGPTDQDMPIRSIEESPEGEESSRVRDEGRPR